MEVGIALAGKGKEADRMVDHVENDPELYAAWEKLWGYTTSDAWAAYRMQLQQRWLMTLYLQGKNHLFLLSLSLCLPSTICLP